MSDAGSSIPYAVSKAGVTTLPQALARVMAPKVRVNAVAPGFIEGAWMRAGLGAKYVASRDHFAAASALARIFHSRIEQRSGGGVRRLDFIEPNETATHRFFFDRL